MSVKHPTDFSKDSDDGPPSFSSRNDSVLHPSPQEKPNHPLIYPPVVVESSFKTQEKRKFEGVCVTTSYIISRSSGHDRLHNRSCGNA